MSQNEDSSKKAERPGAVSGTAGDEQGESTRIIEGRWKCRNCRAEGILGRHKQCPTCGNPREDGAEMDFDFGATDAAGASTSEAVVDEKALELALAGEDWFCEYCSTGNRGDSQVCRNCAAARTAGATRAPRSPSPQVSPELKREGQSKSGQRRFLWIFLGILFLLVGYGYWATREKKMEGRVVATHWKHVTTKQSFLKTTAQGWRSNLHLSPSRMPNNGQGEFSGVDSIGSCVTKVQSTVRQACGSQRVCHSTVERYSCGTERRCQTKSLKNGFAKEVCSQVPKTCTRPTERCTEEPKICEVPVFGSWCNYETYAWKEVESKTEEGDWIPTRWTDLPVGPLDRIEKRAEYTSTIEFQHRGEKREWLIKANKESEFTQWPKGQVVPLRITNAGSQPELAVPPPVQR